MPELQPQRLSGAVQPNIFVLTGTIEVSGGAITNQTGQRNSGVTWSRNAAGDYRATLHAPYRRCMGLFANVCKPVNGTVPTLAAGNLVLPTGVSSAMMLGTSGVTTTAPGLICCRTDTNVLADPTNGDFIAWLMLLSRSP